MRLMSIVLEVAHIVLGRQAARGVGGGWLVLSYSQVPSINRG